GVFVPDLDDQFVGVTHGEVRGAFADLDVGGETEFTPVGGDELSYVGPRAKGRHYRDLEAQWGAARQGAFAVGAAGQSDAVEQFVGAGRVVFGVLEGVLVTRVVRVPRSSHGLADLAETEEGRFADLFAFDTER